MVEPLNIAILVVGTRGDVQPFVAIGKALQRDGHRVRLATHVAWSSLVKSSGLEYFALAGDPHMLTQHHVQNQGVGGTGFSGPDVKNDGVKMRHQVLREVLVSCWEACTAKGANGMKFQADAILANPVAFGHAHCAEKLNVPLHIYFTMPWHATSAFPHPMAPTDRLPENSVLTGPINLLTHYVAEGVLSSALGYLMNDFRLETLQLPRTRIANILANVPTTYLWSPSMIPKPANWGDNVDVTGFIFHDDISRDFTPDPKLAAFLQGGSAPVYIGFGSVGASERTIDAVAHAIQANPATRFILAADLASPVVDSRVFVVKDVPHDWLFPQCSGVVCHGGSGTTASALRAGQPTLVVPFVGDQPFWARKVFDAGCGPKPIPGKALSGEKLASSITSLSGYKSAAEAMAVSFAKEDGVKESVESFYKHLRPISENEPFKTPFGFMIVSAVLSTLLYLFAGIRKLIGK